MTYDLHSCPACELDMAYRTRDFRHSIRIAGATKTTTTRQSPLVSTHAVHAVYAVYAVYGALIEGTVVSMLSIVSIDTA